MILKKTNPGLSLAFASALSFSFLNIGIRYALDVSDLSVWGILFLRGLTALATAFVLALLLKASVIGRDKGTLALIGFCNFASAITLTMAIDLIPLYQALVLLYTFPALTVPLGYLINGDKVNARSLMLVGAAFAGCVILLWPDQAAGLDLGFGHLIGASTPIFYSLAFVLANRLGEGNNGLEPLFYFGLWATLGNLAIIVFLPSSGGLPSPQLLAPGFGLGALAVSGLLCGYAALRWIKAYKVGVIGTLEVFGGILASWLFFGDPISLRALLGGAVILTAALKLRSS